MTERKERIRKGCNTLSQFWLENEMTAVTCPLKIRYLFNKKYSSIDKDQQTMIVANDFINCHSRKWMALQYRNAISIDHLIDLTKIFRCQKKRANQRLQEQIRLQKLKLQVVQSQVQTQKKRPNQMILTMKALFKKQLDKSLTRRHRRENRLEETHKRLLSMTIRMINI